MRIKDAEPKGLHIRQLNDLLAREDVDANTRQRISDEIRMIRAGETGERDAAREIDFYHQASKYWMIIHDLRIRSRDRVAQIDHLLINRFLEFWVCESKHFSDGVAVNERDEWEAIYDGKRMGIPSPVEQNKRHIAVLKAVISEGKVAMPGRLGLKLRPRFENVILVSNYARIERPSKELCGSVLIVKADQLRSKIEERIEKSIKVSDILKIASSKTLEALARQIAALNEPATPNWAAKFGLPNRLVHSSVAAPTACCECGETVSGRVVEFCLADMHRFGGKIYCIRCQSKFPHH